MLFDSSSSCTGSYSLEMKNPKTFVFNILFRELAFPFITKHTTVVYMSDSTEMKYSDIPSTFLDLSTN